MCFNTDEVAKQESLQKMRNSDLSILWLAPTQQETTYPAIHSYWLCHFYRRPYHNHRSFFDRLYVDDSVRIGTALFFIAGM